MIDIALGARRVCLDSRSMDRWFVHNIPLPRHGLIYQLATLRTPPSYRRVPSFFPGR